MSGTTVASPLLCYRAGICVNRFSMLGIGYSFLDGHLSAGDAVRQTVGRANKGTGYVTRSI